MLGQTLQSLFPTLPARLLLMSDQPIEGLSAKPVKASKATQYLGQSHELLIYDAWAGVHPDGFAAITGTLAGGGVLVLLAPELQQGECYDDPDYDRLCVYPRERESLSQYFLKRFYAGLARHEDGIFISEGCPSRWLSKPSKSGDILLDTERGTDIDATDVTGNNERVDGLSGLIRSDTLVLTEDQEVAVEALCRLPKRRAHRPLVITADRGRGKTSALGIAVAQMISDKANGQFSVLITAPSPQACEAAFAMLAVLIPEGTRTGHQFTTSTGCLCFIAPDQLLLKQPVADLVMVDEAAALPVPMLERILRTFPRVVYSSTIHGYEGSGRGFTQRFFRILSEKAPQWRHLHLRQPIRWAVDDSLEASVNRWFLLDSEGGDSQHTSTVCDAAVVPHIRAVSQVELSEQPGLLARVFDLLVQAHYRTTPDDLRNLLDGPNLRLFVLQADGSDDILAVASVAEEGLIEEDLWHDILVGRRRPRGHLIPQALAFYNGCPEILGLSGWRIMRIVVTPDYQGKGLGSHLVAYVEQAARVQEVDWIGSSFGATPELLNFWQRSEFDVRRLGIQRDAASGEHSALVTKSLNNKSECLLTECGHVFEAQVLSGLSSCYRDVDPQVILRILPQRLPSLNAKEWTSLSGFSDGHRLFESSVYLLQRLTLEAQSGSELYRLEMSDRDWKLWCRRVFQAWSVDEIVKETGLSGEAELTKCLKNVCREWMDTIKKGP